MWVHLSKLPIDYYDVKVLHVVGDRIGRTLRVDKNVFSQERVNMLGYVLKWT